MLEHRQLTHHRDPKIKQTWTTSAADKFGRLFQVVESGSNDGKRVQGTNTFFFIHHRQVPKHKFKDITYARFVCSIREMKTNENRTKVTVGGNKITCNGDVETPTAQLETAKLLFNSVTSRPNAKFMTLDLATFYLMTLMGDYEHLRIKLTDIPQ